VKDFFLAGEIQGSCESDDQALLWQIAVQQLALVRVLFFSYKNKFPTVVKIKTNYIDSLEGARCVDNEGVDNKTEGVRSLKIESTLMCREPES
jgi:hypothetical protein